MSSAQQSTSSPSVNVNDITQTLFSEILQRKMHYHKMSNHLPCPECYKTGRNEGQLRFMEQFTRNTGAGFYFCSNLKDGCVYPWLTRDMEASGFVPDSTPVEIPRAYFEDWEAAKCVVAASGVPRARVKDPVISNLPVTTPPAAPISSVDRPLETPDQSEGSNRVQRGGSSVDRNDESMRVTGVNDITLNNTLSSAAPFSPELQQTSHFDQQASTDVAAWIGMGRQPVLSPLKQPTAREQAATSYAPFPITLPARAMPSSDQPELEQPKAPLVSEEQNKNENEGTKQATSVEVVDEDASAQASQSLEELLEERSADIASGKLSQEESNVDVCESELVTNVVKEIDAVKHVDTPLHVDTSSAQIATAAALHAFHSKTRHSSGSRSLRSGRCSVDSPDLAGLDLIPSDFQFDSDYLCLPNCSPKKFITDSSQFSVSEQVHFDEYMINRACRWSQPDEIRQKFQKARADNKKFMVNVGFEDRYLSNHEKRQKRPSPSTSPRKTPTPPIANKPGGHVVPRARADGGETTGKSFFNFTDEDIFQPTLPIPADNTEQQVPQIQAKTPTSGDDGKVVIVQTYISPVSEIAAHKDTDVVNVPSSAAAADVTAFRFRMSALTQQAARKRPSDWKMPDFSRVAMPKRANLTNNKQKPDVSSTAKENETVFVSPKPPDSSPSLAPRMMTALLPGPSRNASSSKRLPTSTTPSTVSTTVRNESPISSTISAAKKLPGFFEERYPETLKATTSAANVSSMTTNTTALDSMDLGDEKLNALVQRKQRDIAEQQRLRAATSGLNIVGDGLRPVDSDQFTTDMFGNRVAQPPARVVTDGATPSQPQFNHSGDTAQKSSVASTSDVMRRPQYMGIYSSQPPTIRYDTYTPSPPCPRPFYTNMYSQVPPDVSSPLTTQHKRNSELPDGETVFFDI